ncbi:MAG: PilZ domain-containing protein [Acidobacteriota bacterium]
MYRDERRELARVGCLSAAAYLTHHRHTRSTLVADLSGNGVQLRGDDLPAPGAWISLTISLPPHELDATGHVAWHDRRRRAIGVQLERGSPHHRHALDAALAVLASERLERRREAVLLVGDPSLAARLCEPLRRHGFLPAAATTPLDAIARLARDGAAIELAIVARDAFGVPSAQLAELLGSEFPDVTQLELPDGDGADDALDALLSHLP